MVKVVERQLMSTKIPGWLLQNVTGRQKDKFSELFHKYIAYKQDADFNQWVVEVAETKVYGDTTYFVTRKNWNISWWGNFTKIAKLLECYYTTPPPAVKDLLKLADWQLMTIVECNFWDELERPSWAYYIPEKFRVIWPDLMLDVKLVLYMLATEKEAQQLKKWSNVF